MGATSRLLSTPSSFNITNEALERLDHEYSSTGGLLSILQRLTRRKIREKAEKTVS